MEKGKLYVVATPIGNLGDITYRAVETLKNVTFILAEDTRETKKLLDKYGIQTQTVSYRDQNHDKMFSQILEKLDMGFNLALVSDAGTPLISDPGYKLVSQLRSLNYDVISIPGPSAVISALSISGLPSDKFIFLGFLPKSDAKRKNLVSKYLALNNSVIVYESPNRLMRLLSLIKNNFGNISVFLAKDISKSREENIFGSIENVINILDERNFEDNPHGEFVCIFHN